MSPFQAIEIGMDLIYMRQAVDEAIKERDALSVDRKKSTEDQIRYDLAVKRWAKLENAYQDLLSESFK